MDRSTCGLEPRGDHQGIKVVRLSEEGGTKPTKDRRVQSAVDVFGGLEARGVRFRRISRVRTHAITYMGGR